MAFTESEHGERPAAWGICFVPRQSAHPIVTFTSPSGVIYPRRISPPLGKTTLLHDILQKGLGNA